MPDKGSSTKEGPNLDTDKNKSSKEVLVEVTYVDKNGDKVVLLINAKIANEFKAFVDECKEKGIPIKLSDCFRDSSKQSHFYYVYNSIDAGDAIDKGKHGLGPPAKPGSSYHEVGLAFDLSGLSAEQMKTVEGIANKHGFYRTALSSNPAKNEEWHFSYTGTKDATQAAVAKSLGYDSWNSMFDAAQKAYKDKGFKTYTCPYGNTTGL